jgi:ParB-like chromosome segregation protein Spo0J
MKTEIVKLSQVQINASNPRTISQEKFDKLIQSILILPKMLKLRPVVTDDTLVVLGGNMRLRALTAIAEMSPAEINIALWEM